MSTRSRKWVWILLAGLILAASSFTLVMVGVTYLSLQRVPQLHGAWLSLKGWITVIGCGVLWVGAAGYLTRTFARK
jgi:hypothetical protein